MANEKQGVAGYEKQGVIDYSWWDSQISDGIKFRQRYAREQEWTKWNKFYNNEYIFGTVLPVNLFFMMARTLIPRIYFRNPSISVTPGKPGPEHVGLAMVTERTANKLLRSMRLKQEFKRIVQDIFFYGTGFGKLGYGSEFVQPTIDESAVAQTGKKDWAKVDYHVGIIDDQPWFLRVKPNQVILPAGTTDYNAASWVAHVVYRPISDIQLDDRLENADKVKATHVLSDEYTQDISDNLITPEAGVMIEIHDRRTGLYFIIAPDSDHSDHILLAPTEDTLQSPRGGPIYSGVFNPSNEAVWGLADSQILEPYQLEINEIASYIMYHRRITLRKLKVLKGSMTSDQQAHVVEADLANIGAMLEVDDMASLEALQVGSIPPELFTAFDKIMQMVQFTVGFSRNQFGEFRAGSEAATAKEAQIIQQSSEIRIDERRDMMADMLVDVMSDVLLVAFKHWEEEQVERIIGPYGTPIWVEFTGEMISKGSFEIKADPDSSVPESKQAREAKAVQTFQLLYPLTQQPDVVTGRPAIDSTRLTRYLLHELNGTQYDDLIPGIPNIYDPSFVAQLTQGRADLNTPISPEALGQMVQQAGPQGAGVQRALGGGQ